MWLSNLFYQMAVDVCAALFVFFYYLCMLLMFIIIKFKISTPKKLNQYVSGGLCGKGKRNNINQLKGKFTGKHIINISDSMCSRANEALLSTN